jgi:transposase
MKLVGKPDAGNPHVRFDERGRETGPLAQALMPPRPSSTLQILGLKRHILVDAAGRLLCACVSPADMHDSRAAPYLLRASRHSWPFLERIWADSAYRGERVRAATSIQIEIVTGPPNQRGFIVQKRRWVVERTIAWIGRNRRLARDYERLASTALAFVFLAAAWVLINRVRTRS